MKVYIEPTSDLTEMIGSIRDLYLEDWYIEKWKVVWNQEDRMYYLLDDECDKSNRWLCTLQHVGWATDLMGIE